MLPTIEYLKENATNIYYFGLGFIQVKIGDNIRYNFYHPELTPCFVKNESVHTHAYDFKSEILKGCLYERLYAIEPTISSKRYFCKIDCCGGHEKLFKARTIVRHLKEHVQGKSYVRFSDDLHKVFVTQPTITKVIKGDRYGHAFGFILDDQIQCTPFISDMDEQGCWDIVEEVLKC